jgi:hypothetical protein
MATYKNIENYCLQNNLSFLFGRFNGLSIISFLRKTKKDVISIPNAKCKTKKGSAIKI